jgi:hypothetical protein
MMFDKKVTLGSVPTYVNFGLREVSGTEPLSAKLSVIWYFLTSET